MNLYRERSPVFSTTHEIASSAPAYTARPKQPQSAPAPSDGFAALIDSAAPASPDTRGVPQPTQPQRSDNATRDTAPQDAPGAAQATSAPTDAKDAPVTDSKTTHQTGKTAADGQGPTKGNGTGKVSSDGKKDGDQTKDGKTDASVAASSAVAVDPNAAAAVAVVVPVATAPASSPTGDVQAAIEAITGTPATTAAQTAGKADPSAAVDTSNARSDANKNATPSTDPKLATATAADATKLSTPEAAEVATAAIATATMAQQPQGAGKTKTAEASAKTGASNKGGDKQVIESSTASASPQQTAEPAKVQKTGSKADTGSEKPVTEKSETDKTETKQDAAATSTDDTDSSKTAKAPLAQTTEHRPTPAAPTVQPLQPDPSVLVANNQSQQLQLNVPNVAAAPAPQLTATVLAGGAPVPLDGLAADIALRAAGGNSRFEIRLDPAELGRIDVRLDVDKHGQVTSHLTVERPATLDMLRRDAPQLQQALEDAGLKTGDSGLQFSLRDQSSSGQQNDNGSGRQSQRLVIAEENAAPAQAAGRSYGRMLGSSGGVDIRV